MVLMSSVRSTNSAGVKCGFIRAHTSSGTRVSASRVTDSVHAKAARSRSLKSGVSRHTAMVAWRCSRSPALQAPAVCTSMQKTQPFIFDARRCTSSASDFSRPERAIR